MMNGGDGTTYKDVESAMIIVDGLETVVLVAIQMFDKILVVHFGVADGLEQRRHTPMKGSLIPLNRG